MQPITFLSAASAMVATVYARDTAITLNQDFTASRAYARIINRCDYDVNLWSILHGDGCPVDAMVTLKKGEVYSENYRESTDGKTGVSIKVSKTKQCKGNDIAQLEYFLNRDQENAGKYSYNYLDVSYVDCVSDCPTKQEGYYLRAGSQTGAYTASAGNTWCPILSCNDPVSCAKMSYILPDDTQTKTCDLGQSMDWYMCGGEAPTEDYESTPEAPESSAEPSASSTVEAEYSAPAPTSTIEEVEYSAPASTSTTVEDVKVDAATVTAAPEVKEAGNANGRLTKTEVVYVTAYEYVNAKRHAHDHARRHQTFRA